MERWWHGRLRRAPRRVAFLALSYLGFGLSTPAFGQGITTATIRGSVRTSNGATVDGALVRVLNVSTGYANETRVRSGAFFVDGLATGGPYRVVVKIIGYVGQSLDGLYLKLGEERSIDFTLTPLSMQLDTIRVTASDNRPSLPTSGGVGTSISDSALRRLPTLNRDMYDFVRLVPQAGTNFGLTGNGASFRYNSYVIDGISDRQLQGNNVMGPGTVGGKTISLEAVKEYQVLLSPYDPRYGEFTGMLVNAVTKSGTNDLHGSSYAYARNEKLARTNSFVGSSPYRREQYGFSVGGPIIRDRLHFFIAPEFQHSEAPAPGPYVGQPLDAVPTLPVSESNIARFASLLRAKGLEPGDGSRVTAYNPAVTVFGRVDLALPEMKSRVVLLENYSAVNSTRFSRGGASVFALTSNSVTQGTSKQSTAIQIFSSAPSAIFNELTLAYLDRSLSVADYTRSPFIQVGFPGTSLTLTAGPPPPVSGAGSASALTEISDHLVRQVGSRHTLGAGVHIDFFRYHAQGVRGLLGQWRFPNLDALANGDATRYIITTDFGSAQARVRGAQPSAYVSDEWRVDDRLSLTLGLRADMLNLSTAPTYNPAVDSVFGRRTSDYPAAHVQWSPRVGFNWEPTSGHRTRIRGGAGIFVGPPPLGWLLGPARSNGAGVRTLTCTGAGRVPKFVADPAMAPQVCADGQGFSDGPVALVDRNLKMAESLRTSLAVDRRLPSGADATLEALYSRVRSDFLFVNTNLVGPQGVDTHGRVMYGRIDQLGSHPALVAGRFPEVIDLRNVSRGYSWSLTAQLDKPFSDRIEMRAAYTYSRTRDVQSLTNPSAVAPFDIWASGRPLSTRHDDLSLGVSSFEIPHRIILAATYAAPWRRWKTGLSFYYIGESGAPFTYNDSSDLGDLNADGTSANDPIYVPRDATDASEILLDSAAAGQALEKFISNTPCLRRQRGAIVARNSCRGPWVHTSNASLRQSLQQIGGHDVSLQLEVFNVLNLLNPSWGLFRMPNEHILQAARQTSGPSSQTVFHFNAANAGTSTQNLESGYQLQLSLRYSF